MKALFTRILSMKERKREKEGSAREIARLPTEMEGGVRSQNVRAVTSPPAKGTCLSPGMNVLKKK
jgi:hypothetical protein